MSRPDRWLVLTVRVPSDELRDELAEGLLASGGTAVEEDVDLLTTFVPEPERPERFLAEAADRLEAMAGGPLELLWRWQDDEDWSARWREGLGPRHAPPRITVTQPWNPVEENGDGIVIVIDPANAFGTGEHATTRGALRLMQAVVRGGERVLDVGSGSGILSIAAARLGADSVLAVESDGDTMETAAENLERNGVAERVELVNAVVDADYLGRTGKPFDLIAANVLSGVLVPLLPALAGSTGEGGAVILGGIMVSEAETVVDRAAEAGLALEREDPEGEWWTGLFRRRRG